MDKDPGLTGNLLVERLVGANVQLISKEEYAQIGSVVCLHYPTILDACVLLIFKNDAIHFLMAYG